MCSSDLFLTIMTARQNQQQLSSGSFFQLSFLRPLFKYSLRQDIMSHLRSPVSLLLFPRNWLALLLQKIHFQRPQLLFFRPILCPSLIRLFRWLCRLRKGNQNRQSRVPPPVLAPHSGPVIPWWSMELTQTSLPCNTPRLIRPFI